MDITLFTKGGVIHFRTEKEAKEYKTSFFLSLKEEINQHKERIEYLECFLRQQIVTKT